MCAKSVQNLFICNTGQWSENHIWRIYQSSDIAIISILMYFSHDVLVVLWLAHLLGTALFGVRSSDKACYITIIRCKNHVLNIGDCVSLVGCGSSVVVAPLQNLGKFAYSTLSVSFG